MKDSFKVVLQDGKVPFDIGAVVDTLQGAGIATDVAVRIARSLEKKLRQSKSVKLSSLMNELLALVKNEAGEGAAERFKRQPSPFSPLRLAVGEGDSETFSRRKLASSLEKQGYSFKESNALAQQIEREFRRSGAEVVTQGELAMQTALVIGGRYGQEARMRYEAAQELPVELWISDEERGKVPYSRGIMAQSLMAVGLGPEHSHRLAKLVELTLWDTFKQDVTIKQLRKTVREILLQEAGEEFVHRYELLETLRRPQRPLMILIGGAPGVGKSSLSSALAYRLGLLRIVATDAIRQALRSLITADLSPELHASSFLAWRADLLPTESSVPRRKRVVRGFQRQVQQLQAPLQAILERNAREATSVVLEGVHLVPGFMENLDVWDATVVEMVVVVSDEALHRSFFAAREVQSRNFRRRDYYLEHFDEIRYIQDFCIEQAKARGALIIDSGDLDAMVDQAIAHILSAALHERDATGLDVRGHAEPLLSS